MEFKQVIFRCPNVDVIERKRDRIGGIGIYKHGELRGVICGCCGGKFKPYEVEVLNVLSWIPISSEIMDDA